MEARHPKLEILAVLEVVERFLQEQEVQETLLLQLLRKEITEALPAQVVQILVVVAAAVLVR